VAAWENRGKIHLFLRGHAEGSGLPGLRGSRGGDRCDGGSVAFWCRTEINLREGTTRKKFPLHKNRCSPVGLGKRSRGPNAAGWGPEACKGGDPGQNSPRVTLGPGRASPPARGAREAGSKGFGREGRVEKVGRPAPPSRASTPGTCFPAAPRGAFVDVHNTEPLKRGSKINVVVGGGRGEEGGKAGVRGGKFTAWMNVLKHPRSCNSRRSFLVIDSTVRIGFNCQ